MQVIEARQEARELALKLQGEIEKVVFGQQDTIQALLVALLAGGHVLLEGVPGLAKTLLVRSLAASLRCSFSRIQFTPDLMPSDITGVNIFNARSNEFELRKGPLFADLVLADEINRAPAKTQSALLEAMQERQVSIDGKTQQLSPMFTVIATQNPIENEGTYPLPEAQLDRFLLKLHLSYPQEADELAMLRSLNQLGPAGLQVTQQIEPWATPEQLLELRRLSQSTDLDDTVLEYILKLVRESRRMQSLRLGCSPRTAVMLMQAAKALALLRGQAFVRPDEVQALVLPVMRHRVLLHPESEIEGLLPDDCLKKLLSEVVIPR